MFKVVLHSLAENEFLKLKKKDKLLVANKLKNLEAGNFSGDKPLQGKHKGKFRKRAGSFRIVYLRENKIVLITVLRIAHRKEVY